ncbi:undecaprenyl-phosphate glucose phosphotransferase [bacterium]|nr:undecaprenyl-phosphate glucose phosphotransferase [bacterium]
MIKRQQTRLVGIFLLSDVIGILISFYYTYFFRFYGYIIPVDPQKGIPPLKSYIAVFPLFLVLHLVIFYFQGFYKPQLKKTRIDDFLKVSLNVGLTILAVFAVLNYLYAYSQGAAPLFSMEFKISHLFVAVYAVVVVLVISFLRHQIYYFMKRRYAKGLNLQNVLIVGAGEMGRTVARRLSGYKDLGFVVKGFLDDERKGEKIDIEGGIDVLGGLDELERVIQSHNISEIYVALGLDNYPQILEAFKIVNKYPVNVRLVPDLFQLLTLKARVEDLEGFPVISVDEPPKRGIMFVTKRVMDVAVSTILLVLLSPLILLVSILIKWTSRGPVLFHQERVGMDGKKFIMHKFRTMVSDAEKETGPVMCSPDDERVTGVGKILRKFSIDEIPQLVNVLKGEMSLIGPRPERPYFIEEFKEKVPKYMLRHKVKSGVTGWAQVHGLRQNTPIEKRLEYDFYYIQNWSLGLDLKILWKTLKKGFIDRNS